MTITLTPETEMRLRERAKRDGRDANDLASALLAEALADDPDDLTDDETAQIRAGIRRGLADCEAGRAKPAAEWAAQVRREFSLPTHLTDSEL